MRERIVHRPVLPDATCVCVDFRFISVSLLVMRLCDSFGFPWLLIPCICFLPFEYDSRITAAVDNSSNKWSLPSILRLNNNGKQL